MAYSKLHSSIVNSSLWVEPDATRLLFITLLAMCDADGMVYGSRGGLARLANISPEKAESAWASLMSPDPDSSDKMRAPEHEGRRVEEASGGFRLLNFSYYRGLRNEDDRRQQNRQAQAKHRQKQSDSVSQDKPASAQVSPGKPPKAHTEAEEEAEASSSTKKSARKRVPAAPAVTIETLCLEGLGEDLAAEYLAHRKRKRANLTAAAWKSIKAEIAKAGLSLEEGVTKALARGWTGFEAAWLTETPRTGGKPDIHSTVPNSGGVEATRKLLAEQDEALRRSQTPESRIAKERAVQAMKGLAHRGDADGL